MKVGSYLFALSPTADIGFAGCKFAPARQKLIRINCTSDFSAECVGALRHRSVSRSRSRKSEIARIGTWANLATASFN
jgi:hypothetical protein